MSEIALFKLLHLLCFACWLGADLGVFYSSLFVIDEKRSAEVRIATAKIMFTLDLGPRISMPLMLPTGVQLGYNMGLLKISAALVTVTWGVCLAWLAMVLILAYVSGKKEFKVLTKADFHFRWIAPIVFIAYAVYSLMASARILPDYVSYKLIIFALTVFCGLMIRVKLRQYSPAFKNMVAGKHTAADNKAIYGSLVESRPYVFAIWFGVLVNVALSINMF